MEERVKIHLSEKEKSFEERLAQIEAAQALVNEKRAVWEGLLKKPSEGKRTDLEKELVTAHKEYSKAHAKFLHLMSNLSASKIDSIPRETPEP